MRIGYAPGVFDLFHVGHLNIIRRARASCDFLIVGVVSDDNVERVKGRRPVVPQRERLEIMQSLRCADVAVVEDLPTKLEMWERLHFDILFKGDDWRGTPKGRQLERDFAALGVEVVYFPYTIHTSSRLLRHSLEQLATGALAHVPDDAVEATRPRSGS